MSERSNTFQAVAADFKDYCDVKMAYMHMKKSCPKAMHISCAYRFPDSNNPSHADFQDDDEHGAADAYLECSWDITCIIVKYSS